MGNVNPESQFKRPLKEQIAIVDEMTMAPDQRALLVHNLIKDQIKEVSNWDMICYCLHFLNSQAVMYDWLLAPMKEVNRFIYNAHYYFADKLGLFNEKASGGSQDGNDASKGPPL